MDTGFSTDVDHGVLEITFNRPERRNPLDYATVEALNESLRAADSDSEVRCVLLRGEGKGFTAGGDLAEFRAQLDSTSLDYHQTGAPWADLLTLIPRMSKPVVAAPHGFVMAGGVGIVAAADVAVAAQGTVFGTSEIKIGFFPLMILPTLQRAVEDGVGAGLADLFAEGHGAQADGGDVQAAGAECNRVHGGVCKCV